MHPPPAEGNFCDDSNHLVKPNNMEQYNRHVGYVDNSDRMANNFLISWCNFKRTKKLFFHLLDLTVLNTWILLSSCGVKYIWDFRLLVVRNLIEKFIKAKIAPCQIGWKTKWGSNKCCAASESSEPTSASEIQQTVLPSSVVHSQKKGSVCKFTKSDVGLCTEFHTQVTYQSKSVNHPVLWIVWIMIK